MGKKVSVSGIWGVVGNLNGLMYKRVLLLPSGGELHDVLLVGSIQE